MTVQKDNQNMDKTFGELIQEALAERGWSNAELARRTGFSATHIGNLIRDYSPGTKSGKPTRLPIDTVDRIADTLGRPRAMFRRAAGLLPEDASPTTDDRAVEAMRAAEMIENFLHLPEEKQAQLLGIMRVMQGDPELMGLLKPPIKIVKLEDITESDVEEEEE